MATAAAALLDYRARAYAFLVETLSDPSLRVMLWPNLTDAGKQKLADAGFGAPEQYAELLQILGWAAYSQANSIEAVEADKLRGVETMAIATALKAALADNVAQTAVAYGRTMWMYIVSFYMGVAMIGFAIAFAWLDKPPLLSTVFGGLGTANVLAFLFTKPPERLQSSRASLAQLQCALLSWFNDFLNQQTVMQKLDLANKLEPKLFQEFSNDVLSHTERCMKMLQEAVLQTNIKSSARTSGLAKRILSRRDPDENSKGGQGAS
jgi:hypothetical protein